MVRFEERRTYRRLEMVVWLGEEKKMVDIEMMREKEVDE